MKILVCCLRPSWDKRLGSSRVTIDLVEGLRANGIKVDTFPPENIDIPYLKYPERLADYLQENAHRYDVVDFPYHCNPWISFTPNLEGTLTVARDVLLPHHGDTDPYPHPEVTYFRKVKRVLRKTLCLPEKGHDPQKVRISMDTNMRESDLINVANSKDQQLLESLGYHHSKIEVIPYGITPTASAIYKQHLKPANSNTSPKIVFVGTFDYRKGCLDFPYIIDAVIKKHSGAEFHLLGTKGIMQTEAEVMRFFSKDLRKQISVKVSFDPESLPGILSNCDIGFFPSYLEGFGIAVVEMLAAGLPVYSYDVPGPCDILPDDWLVSRGDKVEMAKKIISALNTPEEAQSRRDLARRVASKFDWTEIASRTYKVYQYHLKKKLETE